MNIACAHSDNCAAREGGSATPDASYQAVHREDYGRAEQGRRESQRRQGVASGLQGGLYDFEPEGRKIYAIPGCAED